MDTKKNYSSIIQRRIKQAKLIAFHLNGLWKVDTRHFEEHASSSYLYIKCSEKKCSITISWAYSSTNNEKVLAYIYAFNSKFKEIGFTFTRNARSLARDIENRLLDGFDEFYKNEKDLLNAYNVRLNHLSLRAEALKKVIQYPVIESNQRPTFYPRGSLFLKPSFNTSPKSPIELSINKDDTKIDIYISNVEEKLVFKIINLVDQFNILEDTNV